MRDADGPLAQTVEEPLHSRVTGGVVRIGDTVRRPVSGDRTFSHTCLTQLEAAGFGAVPRFLGIDEAGREMLSFIPGEVPADLGDHDDATLHAAAALLRRFHDATAGLDAVRDCGEVACHNDWAPTNAVFRRGQPVALIDFDTMAPGPRLWDLGYSAFAWLDLGNDDYSAAQQLRRLKVFADSYALAGVGAIEVAAFALARQTALAVSAEARGLDAIARWASDAARWTALNLVERLVPTGYPAP